MGQNQPKQVINPNNSPKSHNSPRNQKGQSFQQDDKLLAYIRQALRNCSTNGQLTKDNFNQVLAVLQNIGFKRLRDTPLADRLYYLFDKSKSGYVSENQFSNGIKQIINDKNAALNYSFKAYDVDGDNKISKRQFSQMMEHTWRAAFRILAQQLDASQANGINMRDIQYWASTKVQKLNEYSAKIFQKYDSNNKGYIEYQAYKDFVTNSGFNQITASLNDQKVTLPLNLTVLYAN